MEGIITNIQKFSTGDGPGIRTTVFVKGCPLRCLWCQNPETWRKKPQIAWYKTKCVGCGNCVENCPNGAISEEGDTLVPEKELCKACGRCVEECPKGARELIGKRISPEKVLEEIMKDEVFYEESGGGVTISGGEALVQPDFTEELLRLCKNENIHTALDTSGYAEHEILENILPHVDLVLYDLKHSDSEKHEELTGVPLNKIQKNLKIINNHDIPIWIRTPIIPNLTDDVENVRKIAELISELENVERYDLLPYNPLVKSDYENIDKNYPLKDIDEPKSEKMDKLKEIAKSVGLRKVTTKN